MEFNSNSDDMKKFTSNNLRIRLMGHCIICLRKVSAKRQGNGKASEYFKSCDDSAPPEIAPKSVVTEPGFLTTFNQVWSVLHAKWKEKNTLTNDVNGSPEEIGISLENVLQNSCVSNVSFSRAPTICQLCCDKVLAVENLMKAMRQQVREINMLLEEGRRRQDGGMGDFEKSLRGKGLEERVILATLQFVGVFGSSYSEDDLEDIKNDECSGGSVNIPNMMEMECDEDNKLANSRMDSNDSTLGDTERLGDEEDDNGDPEYIKSERELEEDDEDDESEEEMVMEDDDSNDPDHKVGKDPLALLPDKRKKKICRSSEKKNKLGSSNQEKGNGNDDKMFPCSCGKTFVTFLKLRDHQRKSPKKHPDYKPFSYREKVSEEDKFPCTCGETFKTRRRLRWHMKQNKELHPDYENYGLLKGQRQLCELCGEWVMHTDILQHLTDHLNGQAEWVIRCPNEKCPFLYVSSNQFQLHFCKDQCKDCRKIWKEKCGHVCDICGFKGTNVLKIRNHVKDKHENMKGEERIFKCPISDCGKMFCVKQSINFHLHEHRYRPPITQQICDKCGKSLQLEEMERHLKEEHGILEVVGCKQCSFKFGERDEMVEHLYEHRGTGVFCDICGESKFDRYTDFREHYFGTHKLCPKKYKCGEGGCDKWYWRKDDKKDHELRMHKGTDTEPSLQIRKAVKGSGQKNFECDVCNVKYLHEDNLISHKIKMHGAEPLSCDICGETFNEKGRFRKHKKEHAGIPVQKEWRCEVEGCGRTFKEKRHLKFHRDVGHGGMKKHVCESCGKGFGLAATLKTHRESVHLGLRPWVCDECGERFTSDSVLKRHKLIHTGERPFGCDICGQRFRHKEVLRKHQVGHEEKGANFKPNGPMKQIRKRKAQ